MKKILIVGGTRFVGPKIIEKLQSLGDKVTIFCRGNSYGQKIKDVTILFGDREKDSDFCQISEVEYDIVYDMCCYSKQHALNLVKNLKGSPHIVFFSTAAVYEKPLVFPLTENSKLGECSSFGDYGARKAVAEEVFKEYSKNKNTKVTIFRPNYILGESDYFDRENYYFSRIIKGDQILVAGNGRAMLQFVFLEETAEAFVSVPRKQIEQVEILNISGNELISIRDFVILCSLISGKEANAVYLDCEKYGLDEERFYDDLYPFPNVTLITSSVKIRSKYSIKFTNLVDGLTKVYKHWKQNWAGEVIYYEKELELLNKINKGK